MTFSKFSKSSALLLGIWLSSVSAHAATLNLTTSQTVSADYAGNNNPAPTAGETGVTYGLDNLNIIFDANITGGNGGDGADGGANAGSAGGAGVSTSGRANATFTLNDNKTIRGGDAGRGGNGAATAGGNGASGAAAVGITGNNNIVNIHGDLIGGNSGNGGNGNGGNNAGGNGATAGNALSISGLNAVVTVSGNLTGGNASNGGTGVGTANNSNGGTGGMAVRNTGAMTSLLVQNGAQLIGGNGGSAGTGGSGTAGSSGAGGRGISIGAALGTLEIEENTLVRGGASGTGATGGAGLDIDDTVTTVTNSGLLRGGAGGGVATGIAADIDGSITTFTNTAAGRIGINVSSGDGVDIGSSVTVTNFTNDGQILSGSAFAIELQSGTTVTNFRNNGTIATQTGRGITSASTITNFENRGSITAANGIALNIASQNIDSTIDNVGGIISSANTSGSAGTITHGADMGGKVLTGGTIRNTATNGNAFYSASNQTGTWMLQDVVIEGNFAGGANTQNYTLSGSTTFTGDVDLGAGTNFFTLNNSFNDGGGTDLKATGGTLALGIGSAGRVTLNTAQAGTNNINTLDVTAGGTLRLNEDFTISGALNNNGTMTVGAGKTLAVDSMTAGGVGNIWNFGVNASGQIGKIMVGGGNAVDFTNSAIGVDTALLGSAVLANRAELLIADGGSAALLNTLSGTLATENSALLNFRIYQGGDAALTTAGADATQVYVQVERLLVEPQATTVSSQAVASVVDAFGAPTDPGLANIQLQLQTASTQQQINDILEDLVPQTNGAAAILSQGVVSDVSLLVSDRMAGLRGASASSDELRNHVWVQGFGRSSHQDHTAETLPYHAKAAGISVGADHRSENDAMTFGGALSFGQSDINQENGTAIDNTVDTTAYIATLYGDMDLPAGFYLEGQVSYGLFTNDIDRQTVGQTVSGDYDARLWNGRTEVGYEWHMPETPIIVQPNVILDYAHYSADDYTETGPGALRIAQDDYKTLEVGAGVDVSLDVQTSAGTKVQPNISFSYAHDVIDGKIQNQSSFVALPSAGSFATEGANRDQNIIRLGAGVNIYTAEAWHFKVDYDLEARQDYKAHSGIVRAGYRF